MSTIFLCNTGIQHCKIRMYADFRLGYACTNGVMRILMPAQDIIAITKVVENYQIHIFIFLAVKLKDLNNHSHVTPQHPY